MNLPRTNNTLLKSQDLQVQGTLFLPSEPGPGVLCLAGVGGVRVKHLNVFYLIAQKYLKLVYCLVR